MARDDQPEPSVGQSQLDMFGAPPAQSYDPDPESVRAELMEILAKARAAPVQPWDPPRGGPLPDDLPADGQLAAREGG